MEENRRVSSGNNLKLIVIVCLLAAAVIAALCVYIQTMKPYAVLVDGKEVALVDDEMSAKQIKKAIAEEYKAEDSDLVSVKLDKKISIDQKNLIEDYDDEAVLTKKELGQALVEKNDKGKGLFTATVVSTTKGVEDYTPDTVYKKDDEMFAGQSYVETEGEEGSRDVTRRITTVNGEETKNTIIDQEIIDKATAEVVYKGTLGLPEGEDWKTYEGDPVFEGADDFVAIAEKYQGVPYKYGGTSLKTGVSCIGYVRAILAKYGIKVKMSHSAVRKLGYGVSYSNMKKGDIICYSAHVAIYIGNGKIIHSTHQKGVHISKIYHGQKIVTIRRVVK